MRFCTVRRKDQQQCELQIGPHRLVGRREPLRTPLAVIRRAVVGDDPGDMISEEEEEECARLVPGDGMDTLDSETARKRQRRRSSIGAFNNTDSSAKECQYLIVAILREKLVFRQRPEHIVAAEHRGRKG